MLPVDEQDWHMVYFKLTYEEERRNGLRPVSFRSEGLV